MAATMLHLTFCAVLLTGALGLPLSSEEKANQYLGLKKQTPLSDYWQLSGNQSNVGEKISEAQTALKNTALQHKELGSSVFSTDTSKDHIMDMLQQSGAHLKQPKRRRAIPITTGGCVIIFKPRQNEQVSHSSVDMLQQSGVDLKQSKR